MPAAPPRTRLATHEVTNQPPPDSGRNLYLSDVALRESVRREAGDWLDARATALGEMAGWDVPRFGASDCRCPTHLFGFRDNPVRDPRFIDMLLRFRIGRLEAFLK